jgi:hypothetical protein
MPPKSTKRQGQALKTLQTAKKHKNGATPAIESNPSNVGVENALLDDATSDSECEYETACRLVGKNAAREVLGTRSREQYTTYQNALVSWARKENTMLPPGKQYGTSVPFTYRLVAMYLDHLKETQVPWPYNPGFTKHYSTGFILNVINAIRDAYRIEEIMIQDEVQILLSNFYKMYGKLIGRQKMLGLYPVKSGRSAVSFPAFKMVAKKLFEMKNRASTEVWPYWNILGTVLSRAERVGNALVDHISVKEDMLLFDLSTSKSDPVGALSYPKCIASNPGDPTSDVFLGLAFVFFCRDSDSGNRLFSYVDMSTAGTRYLKKVLDSLNESEIISLGCSKDYVGLHSAKKTGCSMLYDNEGTVAVAIERRCDHSLHGSQGCYVSELPSNDAFNARILAGLQFGTEEFASKPCHFDGVPSEVWEKIPWSSIIQGYSTFSTGCKAAMPLLLASVVHHESFIRNHLRSVGGHPILFTPLFTTHKHVFEMMRPYLKLGICQSDMTTTGVPLSSKTHAAVNRIEQKLAKIEGAMLRLNLMQSIPDSAVSPFDAFGGKLDKILAALGGLSIASTGTDGLILKTAVPVWSIGYLPSDFRIASLSIAELWRAWHVATSSSPALHSISGKMLPAGESRIADIRQISRYSKVVCFIKGTSHVSAKNEDLEEWLKLLWMQCQQIADETTSVLGPLHQAAATFYNAVSANKKMKDALLSSSRPALVMQTASLDGNQLSITTHNGIFFEGERARIREIGAQHNNAAPDIRVPTPLTSLCAPEVAEVADGNALSPASGKSRSRIVLEDYSGLYTKSDDERAVSVLPKLSVYQTWTAWWHATPDLPFPLRCLSVCARSYTSQGAELTRFCRYQKIVRIIQSGMTDDMCEDDPERAFYTSFSALGQYLRDVHGIQTATSTSAPASLYNSIIALGDLFKPPIVRTLEGP